MLPSSRSTRIAALALLLGAAIAGAWLQLGLGLEGSGETISPSALSPIAAAAESPPGFAPLLDELLQEQRSELDVGVAEVTPANSAPESRLAVSGRVLTGRVLEPQGRPVAGALVALIEVRNGSLVSSEGAAKTETNSRGQFELPVPDWA